jgi:hypothetical protein
MTVAQFFPLLLASVYQNLVQMPDERIQEDPAPKAKGKRAPEPKATGGDETVPDRRKVIGALLVSWCHAAAQFFFLHMSRARELHADRFAAEITGKPNVLATALVKISLGAGGLDPEIRCMLWCNACRVALHHDQIYEGLCRVCDRPVVKKEIKREGRSPALEAIGALGMVDPQMAKSFAAVAYALFPQGGFYEGKADYKKILHHWVQWETEENPWVGVYELLSTHPLLSCRLAYLSTQAEAMGQAAALKFVTPRLSGIPQSTKTTLGKLLLAPWLCFFIGLPALLAFNIHALGLILAATGVIFLVAVRNSYPRNQDEFPTLKIGELVKKNDIVHYQALPCTLTGRLLGVGERKPFAQQEFLLRDDTGALSLDFRNPLLRPSEFVFSPLRGKEMAGADVRITGWYRRAPVPYVELESLKIGNDTLQSPVRSLRSAGAGLLVLAGTVMLVLAHL